MQILIPIKETLKAEQALKDKIKSLSNLSALMGAIGTELEGTTRTRFKTETDPEGAPWAALKPSTLARKKRNRGRILTEYGDLAKSITHHATRSTARIGTPEKKGAYLQMGTKRMPPRPFLGLSTQDKRAILKLIWQHISTEAQQ